MGGLRSLSVATSSGFASLWAIRVQHGRPIPETYGAIIPIQVIVCNADRTTDMRRRRYDEARNLTRHYCKEDHIDDLERQRDRIICSSRFFHGLSTTASYTPKVHITGISCSVGIFGVGLGGPTLLTASSQVSSSGTDVTLSDTPSVL